MILKLNPRLKNQLRRLYISSVNSKNTSCYQKELIKMRKRRNISKERPELSLMMLREILLETKSKLILL